MIADEVLRSLILSAYRSARAIYPKYHLVDGMWGFILLGIF